MPVIFVNTEAHIVQFSFEPAQFPEVLRAALEQGTREWRTDTARVENVGGALIAGGFEIGQCRQFIEDVMNWGEGYRNLDRVLGNADNSISEALQHAHQSIQDNEIGIALDQITNLQSLGVAFGTKILKFLDPARCVVLDRVISSRLGYPLSREGYLRFIGDCTVIRDSLIAQGLHRNGGQPFRIADVEMAIYRICQGN